MHLTWLLALSWAGLALAFASVAEILVDIYRRGHRQPVRIMEVVWPVTALYFGPAAVAAYRSWGRPQSPSWRQRHGNPPARPRYVATATGVCHCGAHCTLGAVLGEVIVFAFGLSLAGERLFAAYLADYCGAIVMGIVFRYSATVASTRGERIWTALVKVVKIDLSAVSVFEVTLFGWLALAAFVFFPAPSQLRLDSPIFWFLVQIGLIIALFSTWPAVHWLASRGRSLEPVGLIE